MKHRLSKRVITVAALLGGLSALAAASTWYWNFDSWVKPTTGNSSFIRGRTLTAPYTDGYIYIQFTAAANNNFGNPRIRVQQTNYQGYTYFNSSYPVYANQNSTYYVQIPVRPGGNNNIYFYADCDQSSSGPTQVVLGYTQIDW